MRVTVAIPIYNAASTLADAVRSVFAQSYQDWELLLVEDGSRDDSLRVARSIRDPRVRVIHDGTNRGLQARLNQIAQEARGEYLARMDADDLMAPERLAHQVKLLDAVPEVDLVDTGAYTIDSENALLGARGITQIDQRPASALRYGVLFHPTVLGRTEWFRKNLYDERYTRAEDFELWLRTCQNSLFARIESPLYYYREEHRAPRSYLRAYLLSLKSVRAAQARYGPGMVGRRKTAELLLAARAKEMIYRVATTFGVQSALVAARSRPIDDLELARAREGLEKVLQTQIPGLDKTVMEGATHD